MKHSKIIIIILSIMLTISVIGNIVLIIDKKNINELEEYNPDLQYVGKWEYGYELGPRIYNSVIEIDENLNITKTDTTTYGTVYTTETGTAMKDTTTSKSILKGEVKDGLIIFKESIDSDGNKKETRIIRYIVLYSDDTLAYHDDNNDDNPELYIKK